MNRYAVSYDVPVEGGLHRSYQLSATLSYGILIWNYRVHHPQLWQSLEGVNFLTTMDVKAEKLSKIVYNFRPKVSINRDEKTRDLTEKRGEPNWRRCCVAHCFDPKTERLVAAVSVYNTYDVDIGIPYSKVEARKRALDKLAKLISIVGPKSFDATIDVIVDCKFKAGGARGQEVREAFTDYLLPIHAKLLSSAESTE